jgi:hypothetical protein
MARGRQPSRDPNHPTNLTHFWIMALFLRLVNEQAPHRPRLTIPDIVSMLSVSDGTIRPLVYAMAEDGFLAVIDTPRQTGRRPAEEYVLTEKGYNHALRCIDTLARSVNFAAGRADSPWPGK